MKNLYEDFTITLSGFSRKFFSRLLKSTSPQYVKCLQLPAKFYLFFIFCLIGYATIKQTFIKKRMQTLLKQHFGYDTFRPLQEEIIQNILAKKDTFVLMPTGGGKSICYQLPSLMLEGLTLVISPLIALMKDQVDALTVNGIPAAAITSSLSYQEIDEIKELAQGRKIKILYIAPERLATPSFRDFLKSLKISLLAIDEAHCISEWGHDFRPEYRNIKDLRQDFPNLPVVALTATATEKVRVDICNQLKFKNPQVFISSFNRANLSYSIIPKNDSMGILVNLLRKNPQQAVIIYCFSRKSTETVAEQLSDYGFPAKAYHAGLSHLDRSKIQENFMKDKTQIIVATIAFGMGINKPDIRLVVHYDLPKTLENYYQETGRAGRDGLPSECVLFYSYGDKSKQDFFINQMTDEEEKQNAKLKLEQMITFAESNACRQKFLLNYFGESWAQAKCDSCDNCTIVKEQFDATEISQKIISCVAKTGGYFGASHIIAVLRGSRNKKVLDKRHDELSVYGIAKNYSDNELKSLIIALLDQDILEKAPGDYPTLKVSNKGMLMIRNNQKISLERAHQSISTPPMASKTKKGSKVQGNFDPELFEELRVLRRQIADNKGVPPFMIFGDVSLREMSEYYPQSLESFAKINGVGAEKLAKYAEVFINAIRIFAIKNSRAEVQNHKIKKAKRW